MDPKSRSIPRAILQRSMLETIARINSYTEAINSSEPSLLNFCVTDGITVVVTRYISSRTEEAASLFFSTGSTFEASEDGGPFRMQKADRRENVIVVAFVFHLCISSSRHLFLLRDERIGVNRSLLKELIGSKCHLKPVSSLRKK